MKKINLDKLKELRQSKGITQEEMASKLGYKGKSGYCQLENGTVRMPLTQAKKIAEILNINMEELFFDNKVHVTKTNKSKSKNYLLRKDEKNARGNGKDPGRIKSS